MATKTAYDRIRNTNNQSDLFVKTPYWGPEVEARFQSWRDALDTSSGEALLGEYLTLGISVSFKRIDESICCTLADQDRREQGLPCLITGWSDNWAEALFVVRFKLMVLLDGSWEGIDPQVKVRRR